MKVQIKYVAVNPDGNICGPIGNTEFDVEKALKIGYIRATRKKYVDMQHIRNLGYSIKKAKIIIME